MSLCLSFISYIMGTIIVLLLEKKKIFPLHGECKEESLAHPTHSIVGAVAMVIVITVAAGVEDMLDRPRWKQDVIWEVQENDIWEVQENDERGLG